MKSNSIKTSLTATLAAAASLLTGCSDASRAGLGSWGHPAVVEKFSGGKLVYAGISTGKINNESQSDGYYFADKCNAGVLTEIGGDVVITRPETFPTCDQLHSKGESPKFD